MHTCGAARYLLTFLTHSRGSGVRGFPPPRAHCAVDDLYPVQSCLPGPSAPPPSLPAPVAVLATSVVIVLATSVVVIIPLVVVSGSCPPPRGLHVALTTAPTCRRAPGCLAEGAGVDPNKETGPSRPSEGGEAFRDPGDGVPAPIHPTFACLVVPPVFPGKLVALAEAVDAGAILDPAEVAGTSDDGGDVVVRPPDR